MKRQSLSELLSTDPIDWQWATHPRLIFLRSQCFMSELPPCRGAIIMMTLLVPCSRRGLLAYVYSGVSNKESYECLPEWRERFLYITAQCP